MLPPDLPSARAAALDVSLVRRIARGDRASLGALFARHGVAVRRFLRSSGVEAAEVDDLVQQTFLDVPRAAPRYDEAFAVRSWLLGIASIMVLRHRRARAVRAQCQSQWAQDLSQRPAALDAERVLESRLVARRALQALHHISPKKRDALVMVALEETSAVEAACSLGVPLATIWTRMHHARRDLRRLLGLEERC